MKRSRSRSGGELYPRSSHSEGRRSRGARRPEYNGATGRLNLDSKLRVTIDSTKRVVNKCNGNRRSNSTSGTSTSRQPRIIVYGESVRRSSRHERRNDSPSPSRRRNVSSSRSRRDHERRSDENRRNETERDRSSKDRSRRETSKSRSREGGSSVHSSLRSSHDKNLERGRNSDGRRYSRDCEKSNKEEKHDGLENEENEENGEVLAGGGPVAGIGAPMWPQIVPFRPIIFPLRPRLPMIPPMIPFRPLRPMYPRPGMLPVPRFLPPHGF